MPTHKTVPLPLSRPVSTEVQSLIQRFNAHFGEDELQIESADSAPRLKLGKVDLEQVRCVIDDLTATEEHSGSTDILRVAYDAIEGIGSYGIRGGKRIFAGFDEERKVKNRTAKELRRGRHYYASDRQFDRTVNAPPDEFVNKIICGDSAEVLARLPDNCVDLIFTSPPYNFGLDYAEGQDDQRWDDYFHRLFQVLDQCIRVLKWGGRIAVNIQPLFSDYIPSHHIISNYFMDRRLIWKGEILWEKNNYNCKYTAWGSWKSPSSPYLKYTWEFIEVFCKGDLKAHGERSRADISAEEFKKWVNAKWSIAPERNMNAFGHPAMFPEELANRVLKLFSFAEDLVLDPFAGVGTVPAVARKTGRRYVGIDISPEYCDTAKRRLEAIVP